MLEELDRDQVEPESDHHPCEGIQTLCKLWHALQPPRPHMSVAFLPSPAAQAQVEGTLGKARVASPHLVQEVKLCFCLLELIDEWKCWFEDCKPVTPTLDWHWQGQMLQLWSVMMVTCMPLSWLIFCIVNHSHICSWRSFYQAVTACNYDSTGHMTPSHVVAELFLYTLLAGCCHDT